MEKRYDEPIACAAVHFGMSPFGLESSEWKVA